MTEIIQAIVGILLISAGAGILGAAIAAWFEGDDCADPGDGWTNERTN